MIRSRVRMGLIAGVAAGVAVMASGCAAAPDAQAEAAGQTVVAMGAINDVCPASGNPIDPNGATTTYKGHTIGFCCPGCATPWKNLSAAEKDAFLAKFVK